KGSTLRIEVVSSYATRADLEPFHLSENKYMKIIVCDNGIGFDKRESEIIFKPLVGLHGKSSFQGNGLGLALVRRIASNHGGIVYAESNEGEGASIVFILPENQS